MKIGGQIPWNVFPICETSQISYPMGRPPMKDVSGPVKNPSIWKESLTWIVPWRRSVARGEFGRVTYWLQTLRSWRRWTHRKSTQKKLNAKRGDISQRKRRLYFFQSQMDESKPLGGDQGPENIHLDTGPTQFEEKVTLIFQENQKGLFHHLTTRFRMPVKR